MGYFDKKNKLKIIYVILTGKERRINGLNNLLPGFKKYVWCKIVT